MMAVLVLGIGMFCATTSSKSIGGNSLPIKTEVLVLDVDGTLYEDDCSIETQIKDNCHKFAYDKYGLDTNEAQAMHYKWGATIRGIVESGYERNATYTNYYNQVYPHLDMGRLRKYSSSEPGQSTGYNHGAELQKKRVLRSLHFLKNPIVVASNSPIFHVKRAFTRLGLAKLNASAFITPERRGGIIKTEAAFWNPLFALYPQNEYQCTLVDDNALNVKLAKDLGMNAIRITENTSLADAILSFVHKGSISTGDFEFTDTKYLAAKNALDDKSFNKNVLERLKKELALQINTKKSAKIVDLGAGTLSMLSMLLNRVFSETCSVPKNLVYIAFESNAALQQATFLRLIALGFHEVSFDRSRADIDAMYSIRQFCGRVGSMDVTVYYANMDFMSTEAISLTRYLLPSIDESESTECYSKSFSGIDLICGCCLADLVPPSAFANQLIELAGDRGGLLYMPITFAGITKLFRTPSESSKLSKQDDLVMSMYHNHLIDMGHHLSPTILAHTLADYGCKILVDGPDVASPWVIRRDEDKYMFDCMLRFIALGTTFSFIGSEELDICEWFKSLHADISMLTAFEIENVDMLCQLPEIIQHMDLPMIDSDCDNSERDAFRTTFLTMSVDELRHTPPLVPSSIPTASPQYGPSSSPSLPPMVSSISESTVVSSKCTTVEFTGPKNLTVMDVEIPIPGPGQVLIKTVCSLISTGTELKIYRGDFDNSEKLDLTISEMDSSLAYPMRYGYSLTGTVAAVGSDSLNHWLGKRVFSFSPHSSAIVINEESILDIPDDVSFEDAAFFPSVETALSLVMDARPLVGEKIAVIGQGLIGQLIGAVLMNSFGGDVTLVDTNQNRLVTAKKWINDSITWNPSLGPRSQLEGFDVAIDVSGHYSGLQTAIDSTGRGGRVILGSWYGESVCPLHLGLRFHRSGIKLQSSQVSHISPELRERWTKSRRFDAAWRLTQKLKPSRMLQRQHYVEMNQNLLKAAYDRLDRGVDVTALIYYTEKDKI